MTAFFVFPPLTPPSEGNCGAYSEPKKLGVAFHSAPSLLWRGLGRGFYIISIFTLKPS